MPEIYDYLCDEIKQMSDFIQEFGVRSWYNEHSKLVERTSLDLVILSDRVISLPSG